MGMIMKWVVSFAVIAGIIKYRYKILNLLLGSYWLRKFAVKAAMNIPGLRSRLIQSTFR